MSRVEEIGAVLSRQRLVIQFAVFASISLWPQVEKTKLHLAINQF
jgi:hypothetical protein